MAVDATMHLDGEEEYVLRHYSSSSGREEFWVLRVRQEDGSEIAFHSHDSFDAFVKNVSELWAEGGEIVE